MHLIPLSIILIATTATAIVIPGPEPYYAICIDTDRRNKLDKQAVASCPPGGPSQISCPRTKQTNKQTQDTTANKCVAIDLGCYCRTPALRDFMEDVKTMACPGKKIDQLAVKAYRVKFNWKCATAFGFEPLIV
ncbi:Uncharacterized protein Vi05172_g3970 [Venturia inaequalis]|nr:Uncharacterized protein Vi05172_g3970 [Venturia inaequalis]